MATTSDTPLFGLEKDNMVKTGQEKNSNDSIETTTMTTEISMELVPVRKKKRHRSTPTHSSSRSGSKVDIKQNFTTRFRQEGVILLLFMLSISGLFGYLTYYYTQNVFKYFNDVPHLSLPTVPQLWGKKDGGKYDDVATVIQVLNDAKINSFSKPHTLSAWLEVNLPLGR